MSEEVEVAEEPIVLEIQSVKIGISSKVGENSGEEG